MRKHILFELNGRESAKHDSPGGTAQKFSRTFQLVEGTVGSEKLEHGRLKSHDYFASVFGLGLEDGHVPIFWLLLYIRYLGLTVAIEKAV